MDVAEHLILLNFLKDGLYPVEFQSKSEKQSFKRRAVSYQLGEGDKLLKVSLISYSRFM